MSGLPVTSVFNDGYIAEVYESYRRDPASVDESWRQYFRVAEQLAGGAAPAAPTAGGFDAALLRKAAGAAELVGSIQRYGHLAVQLDPLGTPPHGAVELKPEFHGLTEGDLDRLPAAALGYDTGTAADVVQRMREIYCTALGYEFEHLSEDSERVWLRKTIEAGEY